jgi:tetratricopeptide (TPR) repeat protein
MEPQVPQERQIYPDNLSNTANSKSKKSFIKRFWYLIPILIIAAGIGAFVLAQHVSSDKNWSKATELYKNAKYEEVAKLIQGEPQPSEPARLEMYAQTMHATRKLDKALAAYRSMDKQNPSPDTKIRIANIHNQQEQYSEAATVYKQIIETNPTYVQAYVNLATMQKLQSQGAQAVETAKTGVSKNPESIVLHELQVSMLMDDTTSTEYKEAVASLKKLDPKNQLLKILNQA